MLDKKIKAIYSTDGAVFKRVGTNTEIGDVDKITCEKRNGTDLYQYVAYVGERVVGVYEPSFCIPVYFGDQETKESGKNNLKITELWHKKYRDQTYCKIGQANVALRDVFGSAKVVSIDCDPIKGEYGVTLDNGVVYHYPVDECEVMCGE